MLKSESPDKSWTSQVYSQVLSAPPTPSDKAPVLDRLEYVKQDALMVGLKKIKHTLMHAHALLISYFQTMGQNWLHVAHLLEEVARHIRDEMNGRHHSPA
ncbi:unnamed protein product [Protopolystoma xenopodis]|uniref:Uncharacterized protein n=1 Tax=Protopolystoma xenopodis TaxID=117903 RepID=A0A3S5BY97_9PLAT|nr:unnamed protein product [Protopolystoma xenopodis]